MQDRDNIEKYIREQVNTIKVEDADRMWNDFSKKQKYMLDGNTMSIMIVVSIGLLFFWLWQSDFLVKSDNIMRMANDEVKIGNHEKQKTNKQSSSSTRTAIISFDKNVVTSQYERKNVSQSQNQIIDQLSNPQIPKQFLKSGFIESQHYSDVPSNRVEKTTIKQDREDKTTQMDSGQIIASQQMDLLDIAIVPFSFADVNIQKKRFLRLWLEYHGTGSLNEIYHHTLGATYQVPMKTNTSLDFKAGFQYGDGYGVSMDSLIVTRGISIVERRKNKDLGYLVDVYLGSSYSYSWNNLQFSIGGKLRYGWTGLYRIYENEYIINNDFIGNSVLNGYTHTTEQLNDWEGLNRLRLETFIEVAYIRNRWQVGLTFTKQNNKLIQEGKAFTNKSNIPFHGGFHMKYCLKSKSK